MRQQQTRGLPPSAFANPHRLAWRPIDSSTHARMVEKAYADPNARDCLGEPVLIAAIRFGQTNAVKSLLKEGADPCSPWDRVPSPHADPHCEGASCPLFVASGIAQAPDILLSLLKTKALETIDKPMGPGLSESCLSMAASSFSHENTRTLLAAGANPDGPKTKGNLTPLWHSVINGASESTVLLLVAGADPNLNPQDAPRSVWETHFDRPHGTFVPHPISVAAARTFDDRGLLLPALELMEANGLFVDGANHPLVLDLAFGAANAAERGITAAAEKIARLLVNAGPFGLRAVRLHGLDKLPGVRCAIEAMELSSLQHLPTAPPGRLGI